MLSLPMKAGALASLSATDALDRAAAGDAQHCMLIGCVRPWELCSICTDPEPISEIADGVRTRRSPDRHGQCCPAGPLVIGVIRRGGRKRGSAATETARRSERTIRHRASLTR